MNILEQEIEDIVWGAMVEDPDLLTDRGFYCSPNYTYVRQLDLCEYGRADIVGFRVRRDTDGEKIIDVDIIELKKDKVNIGTFLQGIRYAKGVARKFKHEGLGYRLHFKLTLVGKQIDMDSDFSYIQDIFTDVRVLTYSVDLIHGVKFHDHEGINLIREGFKSSNDLFPILRANHKKNIKNRWELIEKYGDIDF